MKEDTGDMDCQEGSFTRCSFDNTVCPVPMIHSVSPGRIPRCIHRCTSFSDACATTVRAGSIATNVAPSHCSWIALTTASTGTAAAMVVLLLLLLLLLFLRLFSDVDLNQESGGLHAYKARQSPSRYSCCHMGMLALFDLECDSKQSVRKCEHTSVSGRGRKDEVGEGAKEERNEGRRKEERRKKEGKRKEEGRIREATEERALATRTIKLDDQVCQQRG